MGLSVAPKVAAMGSARAATARRRAAPASAVMADD
jgi:hypothetical protein